MNLVSKILLGAVVIVVFAVLWYLLTQKNRGGSCCSGCSGDCSCCASPCGKQKEDKPQ